MGSPLSVPSRQRWIPVLVALGAALLICGPILLPGVVITHDMAWSPRPTWTPFVLGAGVPAPRAVPSDAVAVLLGRLLGADIAQAMILTGILTLAGAGAARLLPLAVTEVGVGARSVAAVTAIWNPFVGERLALGHWTVLLGYAVCAWLIAAGVAARSGEGRALRLAGWMCLAGTGGANSLVLAGPTALAILLWPPTRVGRPRPRAALACTAALAGSSAVWAVPALGARVVSDPVGGEVFAARADTPFGLVLSLLTGGGIWSRAAQDAVRGPQLPAAVLTLLVAGVLAVALPRLIRSALAPLVGLGYLGLGIVSVSGSGWGRPGWSAAVAAITGGGLVRDSQKLLAPWVLLVAVAAGIAAHRCLRNRALQRVAPVPVVALVLLPLGLQPTLTWGLSGKLHSVTVPPGYLATAGALNALEPGVVGVLPWNQYRRYPWNDGRVSLTLAPRVIDRRMLVNDALPTRIGLVGGEDPRAAAVSAEVAAGADVVEAFRRQGVRFVLIEADLASRPTAGASLGIPASLRHETPAIAGPDALVYDLGDGSAGPDPSAAALRSGWIISPLTCTVVMVVAGVQRIRRRGQMPVRRISS